MEDHMNNEEHMAHAEVESSSVSQHKKITSVSDIPQYRDYKEQFYNRALLDAVSAMLGTQIGRSTWQPNLGSFVCQQKIDHVSDMSDKFEFRRTAVLAAVPVLCGWDQAVTFPPEFDKEFVLTYNGTVGIEFEVVPDEYVVSSEETAAMAITDLAVVFAEQLTDLIVEFFRTVSGSEFTPGIYMKPDPKLNQYKDQAKSGVVKNTVVFSWDFQCLVPSQPEVLDTFMAMSMESVLRTLTHFDRTQFELPEDTAQADRYTKLCELKDRYDQFGRSMVAGIASIYGSAANAFAEPETQTGESDGSNRTTH